MDWKNLADESECRSTMMNRWRDKPEEMLVNNNVSQGGLKNPVGNVSKLEKPAFPPGLVWKDHKNAGAKHGPAAYTTAPLSPPPPQESWR